MRPEISLPGFERLRQVCRIHGMELHQEPPVSLGLVAGESVAGLPCDPVLADVHARVGKVVLTDGIFLFPSNSEEGSVLENENKEWRQQWPAPFKGLLVFAQDPGLAYYFATVPSLADDKGIQPVVWVDTYEDLCAIPIASSVDRLFDTYSRALECWVELIREDAESKARHEAEFGPPAPDSLWALLDEQTPVLNFPFEALDLIARDEPLVELLRAGRFDFLMESCPDALSWAAKVLAAASP